MASWNGSGWVSAVIGVAFVWSGSGAAVLGQVPGVAGRRRLRWCQDGRPGITAIAGWASRESRMLPGWSPSQAGRHRKGAQAIAAQDPADVLSARLEAESFARPREGGT
jgi:hypothetical protein